MTIRMLWPKWSGPKVVILSGVYCVYIYMHSNNDNNIAKQFITHNPITGLGKHFLRRATLKTLLLPRAACSYYIYYIYKRFEKFYMNYHKMKVTIVNSGWMKMRFQMKRVEKNLIILI